MKRARLFIPALLLIASSAAFFARATCNPIDTGTPANDIIVCDTTNPPSVDVEGGDGNDTIIIDSGVVANVGVSGGVASGTNPESGSDTIINNGTINQSLLGDSSNGAGSGSDTIVNNGVVTGAVIGDAFAGPSSGSDTIINNGTIGNGLYGDTGSGFDGTGNDTIVNNGTVVSHIYGDSSFGSGYGDDTVTNNGTVIGNIYGDSFTDDGTGDDTITNNGTVVSIYGDNASGDGVGNDVITNNAEVQGGIAAGGGSDTVIIQGSTATVGGVIDGGDGYDALTFSLTSNNPEELQAWAAQIAAANPAGGTLTFNGHTYTWINFEELTRLVFSIARINAVAAPVAVFCALNGGVNTYFIVGQNGTFSLNASAQQLSNSIAQAQASSTNVLISSAADSSLYALPSGEIQVNTPGGYDFRFTYQGFCGTLPPPQVITPEPELEEDPPFTIINQAYGG